MSDEKKLSMDEFVLFLRKHKMEEAEALLKKEWGGGGGHKTDDGDGEDNKDKAAAKVKDEPAAEVNKSGAGGSSMLSSYSSEGDPSFYEEVYQDLINFVDSALDLYRHELALILYPVFVHMYLELVYNGHERQAQSFIRKYGPVQESFYAGDVQKLGYITKKLHMSGSELMENFQTSQFTVRLSRDSYSQMRQLKKAMSEKKHTILWNIIQEHLYLDVYEGIARNKRQIDATSGGMIGESNRQANRAKVYYGLQKEIDLSAFLMPDDEEDAAGADGDKPKKKKTKKDMMALRKQKADPHAPPLARMPFPDLRDVDKIERAKALKESLRRQNLGPDSLPSVCLYSVVNSSASVSAVEFSDDSSYLALGFTNSNIRVFSLLASKLRGLKSADELEDIDNDADDVLHRMLDDTTSESAKSLLGHSSSVFGLSFSPDRATLLSCSEDGTIRLWSLQTWTCLVVYKGHLLPVWQVLFCPLGYYFASCGQDKTARLWTTENSGCLRIFAGHFSGVDCITFHPNSNYVASGSGDRNVRLWDCATGNCVRLMTGHKDVVSTLCFSMDGRFLASGGSDSRVLLWDIAHGHLLADFGLHSNTLTSICFSRDNTVLTTASTDCSIHLWDFSKLVGDLTLEEVNVTANPNVIADAKNYKIQSFATKDTPVVGMHYTRRNLLLAVGTFI